MNSDPWYYAYHYSQPPLVERLPHLPWGSLKRKKLKSSLIKKLIDLRNFTLHNLPKSPNQTSQSPKSNPRLTVVPSPSPTNSRARHGTVRPRLPHRQLAVGVVASPALAASPLHVRQCRHPLPPALALASPLKSKPSPVPSPSPSGSRARLCCAASRLTVVSGLPSPGSRGLASAVLGCLVRRSPSPSPSRSRARLASRLSRPRLAVRVCRHPLLRLSRSLSPLKSNPHGLTVVGVVALSGSRGLACACGVCVTLPPALAYRLSSPNPHGLTR
ncbi:hypothetical protein Scep_026286 [Stephania cephalantha]|uniref:Uncharacterized protein n=1 Tax=Stephania cephalantha TaxID=152367 RepID=A0AAP0EQ49_9MAGN